MSLFGNFNNYLRFSLSSSDINVKSFICSIIGFNSCFRAILDKICSVSSFPQEIDDLGDSVVVGIWDFFFSFFAGQLHQTVQVAK